MDGIFEDSDSPLLPLLRLWDSSETLLINYHDLILSACFAAAYFRFRGTFRSAALVSGCLCWMKRHEILIWTADLLTARNIFTALGSLGLILTLTQLVSWACFRTYKPTGPFSSRPHFIPARTTHRRMFPEKHSFSYSYLLAGIPVGWKGNKNGMISVGPLEKEGMFAVSKPRKSWYHVDADDYLSRGSCQGGLRGKLSLFLMSQNIDPMTYPHVYLVTAAKFLGYHFNPVSIWYLYSIDRTLSAIVLEVNNTFGERRPYLVFRDFEAEKKQLQDSPPEQPAAEVNEGRAQVRNSWSKDFHVSPFNSRKGSYSLMAADPWSKDGETFLGIDVTINLSSSKGHPKLVARLFSDGPAVDPPYLSVFGKIRFLLTWFWVGYVTFPRIVKEAALLWFKRKLHVWYRPEPLKESQGRLADDLERTLETAFREYLCSLVESSPTSLRVKYTPSGIGGPAEEIFQSAAAAAAPPDSPEVDELVLKILTPAFYSRFAGYAHDVEAIFCEMAESCTLWADKPDMLPKVFMRKPSPPLHATSVIDYVGFKIIKALRQRPEVIKRPLTSADAQEDPSQNSSVDIKDIRDFRMSSMDAFILGQNNAQLKADYRNALLRLFLANQFFFGFVQLFDIILLWIDIGFTWFIVQGLPTATEARTPDE